MTDHVNTDHDKPVTDPAHGPRRHTWQQFQACGMLWLLNTYLHTFGWAIVMSFDADTDEFIEAYPVRTPWRGFPKANNDRGITRVSSYMRDAGAALAEEIEDDSDASDGTSEREDG